jgi:hypothetical protein
VNEKIHPFQFGELTCLRVTSRNNDGAHVVIIKMIKVKVFLNQFDILVDSEFLAGFFRLDFDVPMFKVSKLKRA